MDLKKVMLLVVALTIAATTAIMAKNLFSGSGANQAQAKAAAVAGPEVLVATRALPVGTIIDAEALRYQPWPEGLVQDAYFIKGKNGADPKELLGTVVRSEITAGQPIGQGALVKPGERGFLAAALGPGMRAVTVGVNVTSGVAGFVFPGDRVDIVLTQEVAGEGDGPPLKVSETILRNIRILAVDQRMNGTDEKGKPVIAESQTVTMEVTPRIAEKIAVAQAVGRLSLSLRSLADNTAELEQAIASGQIDVPEGVDARAERAMLLAIANRPSDGGSTATVGADVSRYQRATVPMRRVTAAPPPPPSPLTAMPMTGTAPAQAAPRPTGPVVRVARGNAVSEVPIGSH